MVRLSILIATQGRRNTPFKALVAELLRQATKTGDVEIIAYWNNGELSIGEIRQRLLEEARGEYVCFVDDDDTVPPYYCKQILKALGEDYIGFEVKLFTDGVEQKPAFHHYQHTTWWEDDYGFYRGVTHLNPIRRAIALQGKFHTNGAGEDESWARQVTPLVKSQNYIAKVMYFYHHSSTDTSFGGWHLSSDKTYRRPTIHHPYFRYHPLSTWTNKKEHHEANN